MSELELRLPNLFSPFLSLPLLIKFKISTGCPLVHTDNQQTSRVAPLTSEDRKESLSLFAKAMPGSRKQVCLAQSSSQPPSPSVASIQLHQEIRNRQTLFLRGEEDTCNYSPQPEVWKASPSGLILHAPFSQRLPRH